MFPEDAEELRPVLETSIMLSNVRVAHSIQSQSKSKEQFLEQAEAVKQGQQRNTPVIGFWRRILNPLAYFAAILLVMGIGTFFASQSALPGDVLYSTKRTVEGIRLSLIRDLKAQEQLQQEFDEERLREIHRLIEIGREVEVNFDGVIESLVGDEWVVAGIPVMIGDITQVNGVPSVGIEVQIRGRTDFGEVYADEVIVAVVEQPAPAPAPTEAPIPTRTPEQERPQENTPESAPFGNGPGLDTETPTTTATATPSQTATATATETATATATRTSVPSPLPTSTATPIPPSPHFTT